MLTPHGAIPALSKAWPHLDDVAWVQCLDFEGEDEAAYAAEILSLFAALRGVSAVVPVVTSTENPQTLTAVQQIVATDGKGVVVRLDAEDILDPASDVDADVDATLTQLGVAFADADVVLDCGLLEGAPVIQAALADKCLQDLPRRSEWRSVVVAFSAFPALVSEVVGKNAVRGLPRNDAAAFVAVSGSSDRPLVFSDYTVGVPTYSDVQFSPIPNIRYASGVEWIIHRGHQRKDPSTQYRALAADIVAAPYYAGAGFSPGDQQIADVASGASGPGNATTHLRAAVSRHCHVVLERLATLGVP